MIDYNAKTTVKSKYIEDSYSSCTIHGFKIYDNPKIRYIRITTSNANCDNMYDYTFEYNYFLDDYNKGLLIQYLFSLGSYHGDLYEAIKSRYGEYLDKRMLPIDLKSHNIQYIEDCFYHEPSHSKYDNFTQLTSINEFNKLLPDNKKM